MLGEWLVIFIIITVILFILALYTMEENPILAIPLIMVNMIFIIIVTYGFFDVEWFYIALNGTPTIYSTAEYGEPYAYIFFMFFFIHIMLFVKTGFNLWKEALETKGEMKYKR